MIQKVLVTVVAFALGAGLAACGSSKAPGIVLAPSAGLTASPATSSTTTPTSTTPTTPTVPSVTTPTSGPLSTEPKITVSSAPAPTKLVTKDLVVGTGATAGKSSRVTVNYVGALYKNGKVFDASWLHHTTFPFTLGQGAVIKGWDDGVPGMKVGGRRELIIPASLGYGASGSGPIPPNATLVFVVDLLAVS
jgi:hypothetical protein